MLPAQEIKRKVGQEAAALISNGMTIGLGTGSTVYFLVEELGRRISQGLSLRVVPTSVQTAQLASAAGIQLVDMNEIDQLEMTIDGADEIDPRGRLIKGGGGALLQEKIVAAATREMVVIADESKLVATLGRFPLPVEVIPFGYKHVIDAIRDRTNCGQVILREKNGKPWVTDHQHYIVDCHYESIGDAAALDAVLHSMVGVVETGLFIGLASRALIGRGDGTIERINFR